MYNTVIIYEHIHHDEIITIKPIECVEKPKTFIRCDDKNFSPNHNRTLRVGELDLILYGYGLDSMYSKTIQFENFKQMIIDYKSYRCNEVEKKLNQLRQELDDIINARLDS